MSKMQNLLDQVSIFNKKNEELLEMSGEKFNVFRTLGVGHYENIHSTIIAEFLNPRGSHGLKSHFLKVFIEVLGKEFWVENFNIETARVLTEYAFEDGRLDILIEDNQNRAIIIENKIKAKDQPQQLMRYNKYATKYNNGFQIVYLTTDGKEASPQSAGNIKYLPISYSKTIIKWLEKCVAISVRIPTVRETLIQFINHVKILTNQDMNTKNKEEITKIISSIDNLKAAKSIFLNYPEVYNTIAQTYFNPKMEEFARSKGIKFNYEESQEEFIKFYFTKSDWRGEYWIGFTFENGKYEYGLCNDYKNNKTLGEEYRKKLHDNLEKLNIFSRKESNWWPFYTQISNLTIEVWEKDIIDSNNFFNDCVPKIETLLLAMERTGL